MVHFNEVSMCSYFIHFLKSLRTIISIIEGSFYKSCNAGTNTPNGNMERGIAIAFSGKGNIPQFCFAGSAILKSLNKNKSKSFILSCSGYL